MRIDKILGFGWEVVRLIGRGSFGQVYEIRRDVFGKEERAALKVVSVPADPSEIDELYNEGYDDGSITRHLRQCMEDVVKEYSLMLDLRGHSNVVYCENLQYEEKSDGIGWDIYIKMELLTPLSKAMSDAYQEKETIKLGIDLCKALMLCRKHNIIHRDIKPQNIFVSNSGDYKLGDFGVAKISDKTSGGTKIGTYDYMAPEIYNNQPYGAVSDIYSVGLVMYWMMNERRTPFLPLPPQIPSNSEKELARSRRFDGEILPAPKNGSAALKDIVMKSLAYCPRNRFQDAQQLMDALKRVNSGAYSSANPIPGTKPPVTPVGNGSATPDSSGSRIEKPDGEDFNQIFGTFFDNNNINTEVELTLEEAALGTQKIVEFLRIEYCEACNGTGSADKKGVFCRRCGGTGKINETSKFFGMEMRSSRNCPVCKGTGRTTTTQCVICQGKAKVKRRRQLKISFVPGVEQGNTIRVKEQGHVGAPGQACGDLLIKVQIKPNPAFIKKGLDIYGHAVITPRQAKRGGKITVPTIEGDVSYKLPPNHQPGTTYSIPGKGACKLGDPSVRGHHYFTIEVVDSDSKKRHIL